MKTSFLSSVLFFSSYTLVLGACSSDGSDSNGGDGDGDGNHNGSGSSGTGASDNEGSGGRASGGDSSKGGEGSGGDVGSGGSDLACDRDADCDDGVFCNGVETCSSGSCTAGPSLTDDGIDCTSDSCDEETQTIEHTADHSRCPGRTECSEWRCDLVDDCVNTRPRLHPPVECTIGTGNVVGVGLFSPLPKTFSIDQASDVVLGDYDEDGHLDIVLTSLFQPATLWMNDGSENFSPSFDLGPSTAGVAGDIDGDGHLDLIVSKSSTDAQTFLGDGSGDLTLWEPTDPQDLDDHLDGSDHAEQLLLGQLDGLEGPDVVAIDASRYSDVWFESGALGYISRQELGPFGGGALAGALVDYDGDGDLDVYMGTHRYEPDWIFVNDGNGLFTEGTLNVTGELVTGAVDFGDLDGEHELDMIRVQNQTGEVWVSDGAGGYTDTGMRIQGGLGETRFADLDGDGDQDIIAVGLYEPGVVVFRNDDGTFARIAQHSIGGKSFLDIGDIDNDGDIDACLADWNAPAVILYNEGDLSLSAAPLRLGDATSFDVVVADFDGDEVGDAFFANEGPDAVYLSLLAPGGPIGTPVGTTTSRSVAALDVNRDGALDVVVAGPLGQTIWLNDGAGSFSLGQEFGSVNGVDVATADVNDDGSIDIVIAYEDAPIEIWLNDAGTLVLATTVDESSGATALALGDLDLDSDLDLVFGSASSDVRIADNAGTGEFALREDGLTGSASGEIAIGDLNDDDRLDLFVATSGINRVYLQQEDETFVDTEQPLGTADSRGVRLGDVDRDYDLDAIVANGDSPSVLWLNDGTGTFSVGAELENAQSNALALFDFDGHRDTDIVFANDGPNGAWHNSLDNY